MKGLDNIDNKEENNAHAARKNYLLFFPSRCTSLDEKDYCHCVESRLSFAKSSIFPNIILWLAPAFPSGLCYCHWPRNLSMTVSGYRFSAGSGAR